MQSNGGRTTKLKESVASFLQSGLDVVFPWSCLLCHSTADRVTNAAGGSAFCQTCRNALSPELPYTCDRCGAEVGPFVTTDNGCVHCRGKPIRFDSLSCLGMYDESLRHAILSAKWSFSTVMLESLTDLLTDNRGAQLRDFDPEIIIPIPQGWAARLTRRFNSAAIVAAALSRSLKVKSDLHVLRRSRNTRPQKRVSIQQRFENQKDGFRIRDAHMIAGKRVLLVDDVVTTGATCSEAARLLKANGATACRVAVLARVLNPS
ncbi:ComF family protein [Fuerstiella marisgermanici]|uniref:DNA utilization protein GntX n=1 Tax=Fuerstiella marisgermanici TaxID=1891926 RepID=A0A1P8W9R6_9PLAN|nr:phosphoribosyltransferase family protein [Fuerstiella marisgermanici]APZ90789.1 DNA utilization protein GntX [Fuerstiella marisgermanici]